MKLLNNAMQIDLQYIYNTLQITSTKLRYFLYSFKKKEMFAIMDDVFKSAVNFNYNN